MFTICNAKVINTSAYAILSAMGGLQNLGNKIHKSSPLAFSNILCGWRLNDSGAAITVGGHKPKLDNSIDKDRIT